jgi:hypothetical protein
MCPNHILPIFLRFCLSMSTIWFQVVTVVPILHSPAIWWHVVLDSCITKNICIPLTAFNS